MTLPKFVKVRGIMCRVSASGRSGIVTVTTPAGVAHALIPNWSGDTIESPATDQMWTEALEWAVKQAREMVRGGAK